MESDWRNSDWMKEWLNMARLDKNCQDWGVGQWYSYTDKDGNIKWIFVHDPLPKK